MRCLARELEGEVQYPLPPSNWWVKVVLALAPCSVLIFASIIWPPGAPFLLTFAGAFASIQLSKPYDRWTVLVRDHMAEAQEQQETAIDWIRTKLDLHLSPSHFQGMAPVGYSPAGQARARRRFTQLARRWRKSFLDIDGRMLMPGDKEPSPAAQPKWLYPARSDFVVMEFVRDGKSTPLRLIRLLFGLMAKLLLRSWAALQEAPLLQQHYCRRAERLLQRVGIELIRASRKRDGDIVVSNLAAQLGLEYVAPEIKPGWVYS